MTDLPIVRVTLYKHGVGFFERRGQLNGEQVQLSFRSEDMNDVLKSLTAVDWGQGQVLSVDYATPQSLEERLAGCSIRLSDERSLYDLLVGLRGRSVRLALDQGEAVDGVLVGPDDAPAGQPLGSALVSVLDEGTARVQVTTLGRVRGVEILDAHAAGDLRFFLQAAAGESDYRQVTLRLSPGAHDLSVSYVAPAPTWRVSYRLLVDLPDKGKDEREVLLLGWGIFDNRLQEDLEGIQLSLVAGMPISFVYDLYTPFTPERPVVVEEARVAAAPVEFAAAVAEQAAPPAAPALGLGVQAGELTDLRAAPAFAASAAPTRDALRAAAPVAVSGAALGELFQYTVQTPVTVRRGQSAMVPIVSADLQAAKALLYNGEKLPAHPVATLRIRNTTGLTLERGPVTVIEEGTYAGEVVLPFTSPGGEIIVAYAVELGVRVQEATGSARRTSSLRIRGTYLQVEEWDQRWRDYRLSNSTERPVRVLVEHRRSAHYELVETPEPEEQSEGHYRFKVLVPAHGEATLRVQERRLLSRQEELRQQSAAGLQRFLREGLIDRITHDRVVEMLTLWEQIAQYTRRLQELDQERQRIYQAEQQIRGNMAALSQTGKEGELRARYVEQLAASEEQLKALAQHEAATKAEIARLEAEIGRKLEALG
jgi:hypothetical protein